MSNKLSKAKLKELYYFLKLPRKIEEKMLLLLRQGKLSKWFSGIGQEAISVGSAYALNSNDMIFPMHRNLGVFTTRKLNLNKLFSQLLGKEGGYTKGRDRTFHFGDLDNNIVGMISHLAAMLPVANGIALSYKLNKDKKVALSFIGEGSTSEGDFHEAVNLASVWNLPVIFLIENNGYGLSTPVNEQYNCENLVDRAKGYGISGEVIDGNNILEVYDTINKYAKIIKKDPRPVLIEAKTFRIRGHEEASGVKYVPKKIIAEWKEKDPVLLFEKYLLKNNIINNTYIKEIDSKIDKNITSILNECISKEISQTSKDKELDDVFFREEFKLLEVKNSKVRNLRYVDAIKDSLYLKMKQDKTVLIMGQDIAEYGGVFKVTEGFFDEFGKERVRNTPITESAAIGTAMGLSIGGFKPIVEMQFADFVSNGFNQIVNNLAKTHYRWGQPINVTLRLPTGAGIGGGPFHSQSNESWFFHVPGLKIVYPSNPYDAKGLLCTAIDDNNPVLFFEHKALYRSVKEDIPSDLYNIELGNLKVVNEGSDITIVTYGLGVLWAKEYAKKSSYSIEILDLRTLVPIDVEGILNSVKKTNRVLILHEDNITGGIGGEISSIISENAFEYLDAPIIRLGSLDTPIPFSDNIEKEIYFPISKIDEKIKFLMNY
tara:strand:+ start:800 stop:2770 length:1971 start_codon:yes stop_codon:yes gene_type:complete